MAEEAKNIRRSAKSRFTRKKNELLKSIADRRGIEVVELNYAQLAEAWAILEGKHDIYVLYLTDEEAEAADGWITELQDLFVQATALKMEYVNDIKVAESRARADASREESMRKEREQTQRMKEQAFVKRETTRAIFDTLCDSTAHTLEGERIAVSLMKKLQSQLEDAFGECKKAHDKLLELLDRQSAETEIKWIAIVQGKYNELVEQLETHIDADEGKDSKPTGEDSKVSQAASSATSANLHLEKIRIPRFEGELREYPQFKTDFQKQVMPYLTRDTAPYTLRSCLGKEPLARVKSVDDDIEEMWKRLDEIYGDPTKVADTIINDIRRVKSVKEGENKRFVELVNIIEDGHRDLKRLGLENEITTTSSVSIIERKLPADIRKEWAKLLSSEASTVDKTNKFPSLLQFLLTQKRAIEYDSAELRISGTPTAKVLTHYAAAGENKDHQRARTFSKCAFHDNAEHFTSECKFYLSKPVGERIKMLKEKGACWSCLRSGHRLRYCKKAKECGVGHCKKKHHVTLHENEDSTLAPSNAAPAPAPSNACTGRPGDKCLLQLQKIRTPRGSVNVMWDNASSLSFITNNKAKAERLHGTAVELTLVKVGADEEKISSRKYQLPLIDLQGKRILFEVYGIEKITSDIQSVNIDNISHLFNAPKDDIVRPTGTVDVLIGYEYAGFHPEKEQSAEHLLLLRNRFGRCVGGTHPSIREATEPPKLDKVKVHHTRRAKIDDFYNIEQLGIDCTPRCGGCKCGKCPPGGKDYTLKEERELQLIEGKLQFNEQENAWITEYPWVKDPHLLPNNRRAAFGRLISTERRLGRNPQHAKVYQQQIEDMVDRGVARKLTQEELDSYEGPIHYISHHDVLKPDSKSTPVRIVFNSSANYMGHVLNDYWAKGPDLLNNLLGILIRFRENEVAFIGDVRKMYHTVKTKIVEQHTHRFLWRDMDSSRDPDTYVIQRVSFGDKPSGTIATVAMRKTAELGNNDYPQAAKIIIRNSYMDDIIDSVKNESEAYRVTSEIEKLLDKGGFKIKGWSFSNDPAMGEKSLSLKEPTTSTEKVLGVIWSPVKDQFHFKVNLTFSSKGSNGKNSTLQDDEMPTKLTKRMILAQINRVYDPMGLAAPFTVRAKILMRQLWTSEEKLDWDDPIPEKYMREWTPFFRDLRRMDKVTFPRCLKPSNVAVHQPVLVIFSDGSDNSYGACAYARWSLPEGKYDSRLIMSKNRLAPNKKVSIDRVELCAAVLSKRLKTFLQRESRYQFSKFYHIVDSQIVYGMIQKQSYGFNTFAATRIGEIQEGTDPKDWYWIESGQNIADWITRGKMPREIDHDSAWQRGPSFLQLPESRWPISKVSITQELPDQLKTTMAADAKITDTLARRINIDKYSNYIRLLRVTGRVLAMYKHDPTPSLRSAVRPLTSSDISDAERFWILVCQKLIYPDIQRGRFKRLSPRVREDGTIVVGSRAQEWVEMSYDKNEVILLPYEHRFTRLYAEYIHRRGHHGVATTVSKIRSRFWIPKVHNMVKSIKFNCVTCRILDSKPSEQAMGNLPQERLKPSPPWHNTAIDLFGPFKIRDEIKKRTTGKCYGVLFNCMSTRAVHVDLAPDYSTEKFLLVLRRFVSLRGYPAKLYSDNGPQLVAANQELQKMTKNWNWQDLNEFGVTEGFQWEFIPADAPWRNGISEALIKSIKRAITIAIGQNVLTFSELQTVCFEAANLVNERPIGRHPTSPDDGAYLCPNDLLLGRSTPRVPSGSFGESANPRHRFEFVQNIVNGFWNRWTRDFFPSLLVRQKWHTSYRNVKVGDIVLIQDSNQMRGNWKLGRIAKTYEGKDGRVRKAEVQYKNPKPNESVKTYAGRGYVTVERPVQRLVIIVPMDHAQTNDTSNKDETK